MDAITANNSIRDAERALASAQTNFAWVSENRPHRVDEAVEELAEAQADYDAACDAQRIVWAELRGTYVRVRPLAEVTAAKAERLTYFASEPGDEALRERVLADLDREIAAAARISR